MTTMTYYNPLDGRWSVAHLNDGVLARSFINGTSQDPSESHLEHRGWSWWPEPLAIMCCAAEHISTQDYVNVSGSPEIGTSQLNVWKVLPIIVEQHRGRGQISGYFRKDHCFHYHDHAMTSCRRHLKIDYTAQTWMHGAAANAADIHVTILTP